LLRITPTAPPPPRALKANHQREGASFNPEASALISTILQEEAAKVTQEAKRLLAGPIEKAGGSIGLVALCGNIVDDINAKMRRISIHPTSPNTVIHLKKTNKGNFLLKVLPNGDKIQPIILHLPNLSDTPKENMEDRLLALDAYLGAVLKHLG
jgi:hypothetical protein